MTTTQYQSMPGPDAVAVDDTPISDDDALAGYPVYYGEPILPRSSSPSPPQTQEISISGSARNTQFPILIGNARTTCDVMGVHVASSVFNIAYRVGEAPAGGLSSITNIEIDGTSVNAGSGTVATGVPWITYCGAHLGAQNQTVDSTFSAVAWSGYGWNQRHQGTAWIAIQINLGTAPTFTTIPVVTCEFDAGSIDDWDGNSRSLSNPACAAYYVMSSERFGFDAAAGSFNVTEWDAFGDFCDAVINSEPRWAVNGTLTGQSSRDVLELILKHGFGATWYWGDEWHVGYLKTHAAAAATATQDDFAMNGGFRFTNVSKRRLPNRIFAWFTDEANDRDDCRIAESTDISPSNCRETQARLELCTSSDMAYRWAQSFLGVMKEESRVGKGILHPGVAKNLAPYERLDITSDVGITDSAWRILSAKPRAGGFIDVDVRQYSSTALSAEYDDPLEDLGLPEDVIADSIVRPAIFGDLANDNTVNIDEDGHLTLAGDATVWEDLRFPATTIGRRGNSDPGWVQVADDGSASVGVWGLGFSDTTDEEVYCAVQLPHSWKEGSSIYPHVHWMPLTATVPSRGVTWALEYSWANIGVIDGVGSAVTFGNTTTITADDNGVMTASEHRMINFDPITAAGKTLSSMLMCRLYRDVSDANDDYADDAVLLEFDIHFEIDSLGSDTISAK